MKVWENEPVYVPVQVGFELAGQGFQQFWIVADVFLRAPVVTFLASQGVNLTTYGVWGHTPPPPWEIFSVSGTQESVSQAKLEFTQILFKKEN